MRKNLYIIFGALFLIGSLVGVSPAVDVSTNSVVKSTTIVQSTVTVNPFEGKYVKLAKKLTPTVVFIDVTLMRYSMEMEEMVEGHIMGSGVFISKRGHILTCAHLFASPNIKWITIVSNNGHTVTAELLYVDHIKDLSLLLPWYELDEVHYIKVRTRSEVSIGEEVIAIGYPFALGMNFTNGIVSGGKISIKPNQEVFWTNAVINKGNSGGPLFDILGNLIGINTMIVTPSRFGSWVGNSFAVTLEEINDFLNKFRGF